MDWDATSCPATDDNLIYGALSGANCSTGTAGTALWEGAPAGNLYFLVVGTDGAGTESSWGLDGANQERNGTLPSGVCGTSVKNVSATCP